MRSGYLRALLALWVVVAGCGSTAPIPSAAGGVAGTTHEGFSSGTDDGLELSPTGDSSGTGRVSVPSAADDAIADGSSGHGASKGAGVGGSAASKEPAQSGASTGTRKSGSRDAPQNKQPISVGILYGKNEDAAAAAGVDTGSEFSERRIFEGMVKAWNDRGGLAGRRIDPVFAEVSTNSSNYAAELAAVCATFTEDNDVAVVLKVVALYAHSFAQCVSRAGVVQVSGDYALGDDQALREVPSLFAPSALTMSARERLKLEQLAAAGRLRRGDKIGVIVEGCPYNERAYNNTTVPVAKQLGLDLAETIVVSCFEGIGDIGGQSSEMQNAVLRFQTRGVTEVTFVSAAAEGNLMYLFASSAEPQGYRPDYALTSGVVAAVQEQNAPKAQLTNAAGLGWLPALDTSRFAGASTEAQSRCLNDLKKGAGVTAKSPRDRYLTFGVCDTFALSDAALRRTRGATNAEAFAAAVQALGSSFTSAATFGGRTNFARGGRAGPAQRRIFAWSTGCGCFDYAGRPFPLLVN